MFKKSGFSLVELIIVIAILAVLAGIAVPYYQDYIFDARQSALKQNMAALRRALEQFKGDHGRGIYRGTVYLGQPPNQVAFQCNATDPLYSELTTGSVPSKASWDKGIRYKRNKYILSWPILEDPVDGSMLKLNQSPLGGSWSILFTNGYGIKPGEFEIDWDAYFYDRNENGFYDAGIDEVGSAVNPSIDFAPGVPTFAADLTSFELRDSRGMPW